MFHTDTLVDRYLCIRMLSIDSEYRQCLCMLRIFAAVNSSNQSESVSSTDVSKRKWYSCCWNNPTELMDHSHRMHEKHSDLHDYRVFAFETSEPDSFARDITTQNVCIFAAKLGQVCRCTLCLAFLVSVAFLSHRVCLHLGNSLL